MPDNSWHPAAPQVVLTARFSAQPLSRRKTKIAWAAVRLFMLMLPRLRLHRRAAEVLQAVVTFAPGLGVEIDDGTAGVQLLAGVDFEPEADAPASLARACRS